MRTHMTLLSSKQITHYLEANDRDLQFILSKVNQLQKLNQKIASYLNPALAKHCYVAQIREKKLILIVSNGSYATQLRFETADLLVKFKQDETLKHIQELECKVNPGFIQSMQEAPQNVCKQMPFISKETANIMNEMADTISDPELKAIMKKIAKHTKDENEVERS